MRSPNAWNKYRAVWSRFRKARFILRCRHRLENRGLLAADWKVTETGREAKFYRVTRKGQAQLETEAAGWQRLTQAVSLILKMSEGGAG